MTSIDIEVYHVISSPGEFKTLHKYTVNDGTVLKSNDKGRIVLPQSLLPAINNQDKLFWTKANGKTLFFTFNHNTQNTEKVEVETSIEKINDETWGSLDDRARIEELIKIENEAKSKALRESGLFLIVNQMPGQPIYDISTENDGIRLLNKESKDVVMPLISKENHTLYNQDQDLSEFYEKIFPISTPNNSTIFLFGPSGSGKTYHTNKMLAHLINQSKELKEINVYYGKLEAMTPTKLKVTTDKFTIKKERSGWSIKVDERNNEFMNTNIKGKIQNVLKWVNFNEKSFESTYGIGRADLIVEILKLVGLVKEHNWNSESSRCGVEWVFAKEGERTLKLYDAPGTEDETAILDAIYEKMVPDLKSISAILLSGVVDGKIQMKEDVKDKKASSSEENSEKRLLDVKNKNLLIDLRALIHTAQLDKKYTYIGRTHDKTVPYFEELIYESRYINAFVSEMARRLRTKVELKDVEYKRPYRIVKCPGTEYPGKEPYFEYEITCKDNTCTEEGLHKSTLYCSGGNDDLDSSLSLAEIHEKMANIEGTGAIFQPTTHKDDLIKFIVVVGFNTNDPDKKMRWRSATKELVEILIGTPKLQTA